MAKVRKINPSQLSMIANNAAGFHLNMSTGMRHRGLARSSPVGSMRRDNFVQSATAHLKAAADSQNALVLSRFYGPGIDMPKPDILDSSQN